jgi:hypothetical protein
MPKNIGIKLHTFILHLNAYVTRLQQVLCSYLLKTIINDSTYHYLIFIYYQLYICTLSFFAIDIGMTMLILHLRSIGKKDKPYYNIWQKQPVVLG